MNSEGLPVRCFLDQQKDLILVKIPGKIAGDTS